LASEAFLLKSAVESVFAAVAVPARQKGLRMLLDVRPEVPGMVVGDEGRLRQVLVNLVANAVKFTDEGEVEVRVELADGAAAGRVRLLFTVRDTGMGIPEDQRDTIFDSFQQVGRSTHPKYGGTGLGLTIAKQLIGLMGGDIWVASRVGQGSSFRFTAEFGAVTQEEAVPRPQPTAAPVLGFLEGGRKLRVLVAEDNPVNQLLGAELLRRLGHEVVLACDGREALEALAKRCADVVLMDIEMPVMGGVEATREIREGRIAGCPRDLPVIALTAHAIAGDRERFLQAGMDDYLSKPFDRGQLASVLHRVVAGRKPYECREPVEECELDRRVYTYVIGPDDVIAFVNEEWLAFARENDAPELTWERVVGRPLWDFLQGGEVRALHRELLQAVRRSGDRRRLGFRCDSSQTLRWMEMELVPSPGGAVEYRCRVLQQEPRPPVRSLERRGEHSAGVVECCSLCRRFLTPAGWSEAQAAPEELGLGAERPPRINEGFCPDCAARIRAKLASL
ncbi:MAG: response regulator, partial [Deltaproteobacteria bacterium]|nr:response regulator [Deltaproteobacteria bacterium]